MSCAICLSETLVNPAVIACNHQFCFECIKAWADTTNRCPLCKKEFSVILYHGGRCAVEEKQQGDHFDPDFFNYDIEYDEDEFDETTEETDDEDATSGEEDSEDDLSDSSVIILASQPSDGEDESSVIVLHNGEHDEESSSDSLTEVVYFRDKAVQKNHGYRVDDFVAPDEPVHANKKMKS